MISTDNETELIKKGDYVIVKTETIMRLVQLEKKKPHFLVKRKVNLGAAVGHPYGSYFVIKSDGDLKRVINSDVLNALPVSLPSCEIAKDNPTLIESGDNLKSTANDLESFKAPDMTRLENGQKIVSKDNRDLFDSGDNQKLTTNDIESFKASGMSGLEVVQKIVENSTSFHEKTDFAKEKYLKKKQNKYIKYVQLLKPNIRLLTDMYNTQAPLKICNLRMDSLSQMLTFCNVMSGGRYMVCETVMDLLITSVIDKLGTEGCAVQLHMKPFSLQPNLQVLQALSISEEQYKSIHFNIELSDALALCHEEEDMVLDNVSDDLSSNVELSPKNEKKLHILKTKDILKQKNMDGLLVAVKNHPANVLFLIDYLSISRPFAIFSMYQEPLVDCYVKLKARGDIILLNISDTWLRKFQVMPDRTHPCYTMRGHGGYIMTGFKVAPKP